MQLNENLLKNFVKAMNVEKEKETRLLYGTITKVIKDGDKKTAYVHLDGAEPGTETPVIEGTAVMKDDRVAVTIENHKAVVVSNITSPASGRTDTAYMDLVDGGSGENSGLKIGLLDESDYYILVTPTGMYLKNGEATLAKYTLEGTTLYGNNGQKTAEFTNAGTSLYDSTGTNKTAEFTSDSVTIDLGIYGGASHTAILSGGMLQLYQNWQGYDHYDGMTRIQPGYFETENNAGNRVSMSSGSVNAEYGCNARVSFTGVATVSNISVTNHATTSGTLQMTIPSGYSPIAIVKSRIFGRPCYFVDTELNSNGSISYSVHNPSDTNWTDVGVQFKVACIWTG